MSYLEELNRAHAERRKRLFHVRQQPVDIPQKAIETPPPPRMAPPLSTFGQATGRMFIGLDPDLANGDYRRSADEIIAAVMRVGRIGPGDFFSHRRYTRSARIRHVAMFLMHHCTLMSYPMIGKKLGNRDHSTVIHGVRKVTSKRGFFEPLLSEVMAALNLKLPEHYNYPQCAQDTASHGYVSECSGVMQPNRQYAA